MLDVLGFGESSVDYVHVVSALPREGTSKLRISSHFTACGGQVATTMAACAALGLRAGYLGAVGNDGNGGRIRQALNARGVDLSRAIVREASSRFAVILVQESSGDRVVLWERDPRLDLDFSDLTPPTVAGSRIVHVDATDEAASIQLARLAREAGAIVTCDVDTVTDRTPELLSSVTVPILAAHVPGEITGIADLERAMRAMRGSHRGVLCVTLGDRGSAALDGDRFVQMPAPAVRAVDTTGAGDVFRAGCIYALVQAWPTDEMLRFANAAAAVSCTRRGAIDSVPGLDEVQALIEAGLR